MGAVFFARRAAFCHARAVVSVSGERVAASCLRSCRLRHASLVAHLSSSSAQEPPAAVGLRHFSLRLVVQALTSIATKKRPLLRSLFSLNNSPSAHRRVSRFPATVRGCQSGHFLETGSLYLPPAALRLFPPSAKIYTIYPRKRPFPGIFFVCSKNSLRIDFLISAIIWLVLTQFNLKKHAFLRLNPAFEVKFEVKFRAALLFLRSPVRTYLHIQI